MSSRSFEDFVFKHVAPRGIRHVMRIRGEETSNLVAQVYRQMNREFLIVPALLITHGLIFWVLLRRNKGAANKITSTS